MPCPSPDPRLICRLLQKLGCPQAASPLGPKLRCRFCWCRDGWGGCQHFHPSISSAGQELPPAFASSSFRQETLTLRAGASCFITQGPLSWFAFRSAAARTSLLFRDPRPQAASKQNLGSSPLRSGSGGASVATSPLVPKGADAPLQTVAKWPLGENIPRVTRGHVRGNGTAAPDRGGPGSSPCTTSI